MIKIKRIYEPKNSNDGYRVLVDRLWPRGISKERAGLDLWLKEIAPTTELRKWFDHDPNKWNEFKKRYKVELVNTTATNTLSDLVKSKKDVTLLYAAKDEDHNEAVLIKDFLNG